MLDYPGAHCYPCFFSSICLLTHFALFIVVVVVVVVVIVVVVTSPSASPSLSPSAAGIAVLDAIEEEGLQENAQLVGTKLQRELRAMAAEFPAIGDVSGSINNLPIYAI